MSHPFKLSQPLVKISYENKLYCTNIFIQALDLFYFNGLVIGLAQ